MPDLRTEGRGHIKMQDALSYEVIDSAELAKRWKLPESWVRDQVRSRASDPLPHIQFGRYVRFQWAHPTLIEWLERRLNKK